eukprot:snap_masked-scaffold_33-processed-gene-3.41-mRNA-1 protein AED:1.00 eAED:1.00 QI:0/-1/0/0/-1/1/1/0/301
MVHYSSVKSSMSDEQLSSYSYALLLVLLINSAFFIKLLYFTQVIPLSSRFRENSESMPFKNSLPTYSGNGKGNKVLILEHKLQQVKRSIALHKMKQSSIKESINKITLLSEYATLSEELSYELRYAQVTQKTQEKMLEKLMKEDYLNPTQKQKLKNSQEISRREEKILLKKTSLVEEASEQSFVQLRIEAHEFLKNIKLSKEKQNITKEIHELISRPVNFGLPDDHDTFKLTIDLEVLEVSELVLVTKKNEDKQKGPLKWFKKRLGGRTRSASDAQTMKTTKSKKSFVSLGRAFKTGNKYK